MLSSLPQDCIPANPEIAGIGIRASTYAQNFIGVFLAAFYLLDGKITADEAAYIESASNTILMTGCAIIISAIIQAKTIGLSVYHAIIVLNLSWMNNTYFSISVIFAFAEDQQRQSQELKRPLLELKRPWRELKRQCRLDKIPTEEPRQPSLEIKKRKRSRVASFLGFVHLSLMAGFGVWLWHEIDRFGDSPQCTPYSFVVIFGRNVPVINKLFRKFSLALYWVTVIPIVNLLVGGIVAVVGTFVVLVGSILGIEIVLLCLFSPLILLDHILFRRRSKTSNIEGGKEVDPRSKPWVSHWAERAEGILYRPFTYLKHLSRFNVTTEAKDAKLGLLYLPFVLFLDVFFTVNTELMVRRSQRFVQPGESQWTFGQTLAVIITIIPLLEARKCIDWRSCIGRKSTKKPSRAPIEHVSLDYQGDTPLTVNPPINGAPTIEKGSPTVIDSNNKVYQFSEKGSVVATIRHRKDKGKVVITSGNKVEGAKLLTVTVVLKG